MLFTNIIKNNKTSKIDFRRFSTSVSPTEPKIKSIKNNKKKLLVNDTNVINTKKTTKRKAKPSHESNLETAEENEKKTPSHLGVDHDGRIIMHAFIDYAPDFNKIESEFEKVIDAIKVNAIASGPSEPEHIAKKNKYALKIVRLIIPQEAKSEDTRNKELTEILNRKKPLMNFIDDSEKRAQEFFNTFTDHAAFNIQLFDEFVRVYNKLRKKCEKIDPVTNDILQKNKKIEKDITQQYVNIAKNVINKHGFDLTVSSDELYLHQNAQLREYNRRLDSNSKFLNLSNETRTRIQDINEKNRIINKIKKDKFRSKDKPLKTTSADALDQTPTDINNTINTNEHSDTELAMDEEKETEKNINSNN